MQLSEFQKHIVRAIANNEACTIVAFIQRFCETHPSPLTISAEYKQRGVRDPNINQVQVINNSDKALSQIREYVSVWPKLEAALLVVTIPQHRSDGYIYPLFYQQGERVLPDHRILALIDKYDDREIVPHPELRSFIDNDFCTDEEIRRLLDAADLVEEKNRTKRAEKRTTISQALTVAVAIISIVVNVYALNQYSKERKVTIENAGAFRDTTKVLILPTKQTGADTTKIIPAPRQKSPTR